MERRPLVLVAEDDPDTLELNALVLRMAGFDVHVSSDGEDAWQKARRFKPDAVVVDLTLPKIDGFEVCRKVKGSPDTAGIPVVAVSGWAGQRVDEQLREAGFDASFLKPVVPDALIEGIRQAIGRARLPRADRSLSGGRRGSL